MSNTNNAYISDDKLNKFYFATFSVKIYHMNRKIQYEELPELTRNHTSGILSNNLTYDEYSEDQHEPPVKSIC